MSGIDNITGQKMKNGLYPFFWQHGESHDILGEYMDKISECGMQAACIEARPHPDFAGDGWWKDLDFIIEKAKEKDMKLWILDDAHFPTGYANGKIAAEYPQYLKWYLDQRRYDVQGPMKGARINLQHLKGRIWEKADPTEQILGVYMAKRVNQETDSQDAIAAASIADITDKMRMSDRLLKVDIPDGAYSIFVVFLTRNRGEESTKEYLNPLVKEATQVLVDTVYEPHFAHYSNEFGRTIQGFFSDEPRFGNIKGTDGYIGREDMVLPWREGLEKELDFDKKYLILLWTKAEGEEQSIRFLYMDKITRLYNDNFTKVLGDWCRAHGVWYLGHTIEDNGAHARLGYGTGHYFRGQEDMDFAGIDVIGTQVVPGMNYHHDAFSTGGSNGEFYHYALAKLGTSAAHLDARKKGRTMCEAFGAYGWSEGLKTMKWIADHLMVRGVNYIVPHAFDPKAFPDFDCPPHFYAHGHNPQFRYFPVLTDYMNRVMTLMRDGVQPAQVGVLYPAETEWAGRYMPIEKPARELTTAQISFDIISRDFLQQAKIGHGGYIINGITFRVLIMPYGACLPEDMLDVLANMIANDIKVIFVDEKPEKAVGKSFLNQEKSVYTALQKQFGQLLAGCEAVPLKDIHEKLKEYQSVILKEEQPDLVVGEYQKDGKQYFYMFNESIGHDVETLVSFKQEGYVYRYDAFHDIICEPACSEKSGQKYYNLSLHTYESTIWILSKTKLDADMMEDGEISEDTVAVLSMSQDWQVNFADSKQYPNFEKQVPMKKLGLVSDLEGWEEVCGTVRYSGTFRNEKNEAVKRAVLKIEESFETTQIFVNGQPAGVKICEPYEYDITPWIKHGNNELDIEVTNTLGTAIRDGISQYLMIEPFGVRGNVTIELKG